jgi:hypothetical protein
MGLLYMMASLDRSNLGNANIAGMPEDIGLVGNQFGTATTLLYAASVYARFGYNLEANMSRYATYVPFEGPIAVLLKVIGPKYLISGYAFCWGCCTLCMGRFPRSRRILLQI